IQERKYTIEERLAVLGLFIKNLSEINDSNLVNDLIQDYQNRINNNIYHGILNKLGLENLIGVQNQFCTEIYNVILSKGISDNRFIDKFDKAIEYLKLNESNIKQREEVLNKSLQNEYSDFISEYKYIYENYLVSYIFNSLFPVSNMSLNDTYNDLIIRFSLIKITLIGLCGYYKSEMKVDYAVDFIQSFVKVVEHNVTIVEKLKKFLNENNINSLAHMMVMIGK
ncbi:flagellin lysine-N-methylase, partial [Terrisporobacter petrolearius]|uniref:flagellin lysine-N-methylase n=1 Tax=Terrisporobacter petrolearius TaxID=1460447 RepID=UPI0022E5B290